MAVNPPSLAPNGIPKTKRESFRSAGSRTGEPGCVNPVDPRIPHAFAAHQNEEKAQGILSLGSYVITHHSSHITHR